MAYINRKKKRTELASSWQQDMRKKDYFIKNDHFASIKKYIFARKTIMAIIYLAGRLKTCFNATAKPAIV